MKAYVIKNEEGKYWQWLFNNEPDWEEKLYNGFMHYSQKDAEKSIEQWQLEDCEVVEITIAEGDLEKQLAEKDKELADWKDGTMIVKYEKMLEEKEKTIKEINKAYIETYKREREKDKEIKKQKIDNHNLKSGIEMMKGLKRFDLGAAMKEFMQERLKIKKETRHQVCEEIRENGWTENDHFTGTGILHIRIADLIKIEGEE